MEWVFDGIGTQLISIVISLILGSIGGGVIGYRIGIKKTVNQKQFARDESMQKQEIKIGDSNVEKTPSKSRTSIRQIQKAGNNADQVQIGGIADDKR